MSIPYKVQNIHFPKGNCARLVTVPADADSRRVLLTLDISPPRALLIINGGTSSLESHLEKALSCLFIEVANVVSEKKITVITGGTRFGIFKVFGNALGIAGGPSAPCLGIAVSGRAGIDRLEPHHSHFLLVEGEKWGEETDIMYSIAADLSSNCRSVALIAGGGPVAITEMMLNVKQQREIFLIEGSHGSTDTVIRAFTERDDQDGRIKYIVSDGQLTIYNIERNPRELANLLSDRLI